MKEDLSLRLCNVLSSTSNYVPTLVLTAEMYIVHL
jgi:hypothetical protein